MPKNSGLQVWIYLLNSKGFIVDQVKVSWPSIRKVYQEAKQEVKKE